MYTIYDAARAEWSCSLPNRAQKITNAHHLSRSPTTTAIVLLVDKLKFTRNKRVGLSYSRTEIYAARMSPGSSSCRSTSAARAHIDRRDRQTDGRTDTRPFYYDAHRILCEPNRVISIIYHHHIISYQKFIVRPLLREPGPWLHYESQPNAKTPRKTRKSTNVKSLIKK